MGALRALLYDAAAVERKRLVAKPRNVLIMITERILVDVTLVMLGHSVTMTQTTNADGGPTSKDSLVEHAAIPSNLYRALLARYPINEIESAIKWLELGEYVSYSGWGLLMPKAVIHLTAKGVELASDGMLSEAERRLVYQVNPYSAFIARQFLDADSPLFEFLRDEVLKPIGIDALDGKVDGIDAFRGEIVRKIRLSRFFVCILTKREQLANGTFASSVWLYQETGAAVALGKKPIVLVERGLHDHYAGELQKNYEYIPFDRGDYRESFKEVGRKIIADLELNYIPAHAT